MPDDLPPPTRNVSLIDQGLLLIYRRLIAVGLACLVAATSMWELPFPRSLLLQAGFFFITSGFLLFTVVAVIEQLPRSERGSGPNEPTTPASRNRLIALYTVIVTLATLS